MAGRIGVGDTVRIGQCAYGVHDGLTGTVERATETRHGDEGWWVRLDTRSDASLGQMCRALWVRRADVSSLTESLAGDPFSEMPTVACPKCGVEYEDMDGFGVLHCPSCGYCTHPSATGDGKGGYVCDLCGALRKGDEN